MTVAAALLLTAVADSAPVSRHPHSRTASRRGAAVKTSFTEGMLRNGFSHMPALITSGIGIGNLSNRRQQPQIALAPRYPHAVDILTQRHRVLARRPQ